MTASINLARILGVDSVLLDNLDEYMSGVTGKKGVLDEFINKNNQMINKTLDALGVENKSTSKVQEALRDTIVKHEGQLREFVDKLEGENDFERAANFAHKAASAKEGFFLKKELAEDILIKRPPENVLKLLGARSIDEVLKKHDVTEVFSSLRFLESNEWMHKTFDEAYSGFTASDFEKRAIDVRVLGPEWQKIAEKFVAKKHHNVSHLKEFGVIFLNPIKMDVPGKFLRDTALFLHYFHEITFYSKLFERYSNEHDFAEKLKALLRGDVPEINEVRPGEWLIVQRYLWKEDPKDPRLFLPRVNPESMHWMRGERDLAYFGALELGVDLEGWHDLDWVGGIFKEHNEIGDGSIISFDLEDNAMGLVSFAEGEEQTFNYHQREAMWTKLFSEYVGGEANMEKLLLENFDKGIIKF